MRTKRTYEDGLGRLYSIIQKYGVGGLGECSSTGSQANSSLLDGNYNMEHCTALLLIGSISQPHIHGYRE